MILGIEINHKKSHIAVREKVSIEEKDIPVALKAFLEDKIWKKGEFSGKILCKEKCILNEMPNLSLCPRMFFIESAIISTCNRTGIYALGGCVEPLARFFMVYKGIDHKTISRFEVYKGKDLVKHIFAVSAGLESQVIGEPQILGQVRRSYELARESGCIGPVFNELFQRAIRVGKKVRTLTSLGNKPMSFATISFDLISKYHKNLSEVRFIILGTGEMAENIIGIFKDRGLKNVYITSKSVERAKYVSQRLGVPYIDIKNISSHLREGDVLISATNTSENNYIIRFKDIPRDKRVLIIDLGLPRTVDPKIRKLNNVKLYDLDDLKVISEEARKLRERELPKAWDIVDREVESFWQWLNQQKAKPVIRALHDRAERIRKEQLEWAYKKLGGLDEEQKRIIDLMTSRIVKKILHTPTVKLKSLVSEDFKSNDPLEVASKIFDVGDTYHHNKTFLVGTRGSKLARIQTLWVIEKLKALYPHLDFIEKVITTRGDKGITEGVGVFVKEIELALLRKEIDLAVHSLKDLPTKLPEGLSIAAIPDRADPRDVLISKDGKTLKNLKRGAVVGTSSLRRKAQIKALRPDLNVVDIRGNVDTRIRKLEEGEIDAIILAKASVERLGLEKYITEILSFDIMLPAVGQGALAVEVREDNTIVGNMVKSIDSKREHIAVKAERAFLEYLGGGCRVPIAGYAKVSNERIIIEGLVASPDGSKIIREKSEGSVEDPVGVGYALAEILLSKGAYEILKHYERA